MVNAELSYNPYLQETYVKFNGQPPRINSHVEKYLDQKLQVWIKKIPRIFRDEMNGYGFDLEFSGTDLDFKKLEEAFADAGISDNQVHLFHKSILNDRDNKLEKVEQLLVWLNENPNRRYDYERIRKENYELFEGDYPYIILHGRVNDTDAFERLHISVENVTSVDELANTNLHNIPILYVVDQDSAGLLKDDLRILKKRSDIISAQVFFRISPNLSEEKVAREIKDLVSVEPQIVQSADDPAIMEFFELFPFTDYIHDTLRLFMNQIPQMKEELTETINETKAQNKEQHDQIEQLGISIDCLKAALDKFVNPDRTDFSASFLSIIDDTKNSILNWRNKKTKITQQEEAVRVAGEFDREVQDIYQTYLRKMHSALVQCANSVQTQMRNWYNMALTDMLFVPTQVPVPDFTFDAVPSIKDGLLMLKEESYVMPKEDFLGRFFKPNTESNSGPVLETTYYYNRWRDYALYTIESNIYRIYTTCIEKINTYFDILGKAYKEHLLELIAGKESDKSVLSSQLSEDEQLLQIDNDWLVQFTDTLRAIARD